MCIPPLWNLIETLNIFNNTILRDIAVSEIATEIIRFPSQKRKIDFGEKKKKMRGNWIRKDEAAYNKQNNDNTSWCDIGHNHHEYHKEPKHKCKLPNGC